MTLAFTNDVELLEYKNNFSFELEFTNDVVLFFAVLVYIVIFFLMIMPQPRVLLWLWLNVGEDISSPSVTHSQVTLLHIPTGLHSRL
jgi:hypothetical protein